MSPLDWWKKENPQLESEINKLSEEIVDDKSKKYIYESPDGGKTIYRREVKKSEKEVVEDFQKMINEQKNMTENVDKDKWSGKYKDFLVKEKQVDKRMEENLKWYGNWKRDNLKNEE
jgi:competence CoiA-like predicted nuclease